MESVDECDDDIHELLLASRAGSCAGTCTGTTPVPSTRSTLKRAAVPP
jgi:hypothetical protein